MIYFKSTNVARKEARTRNRNRRIKEEENGIIVASSLKIVTIVSMEGRIKKSLNIFKIYSSKSMNSGTNNPLSEMTKFKSIMATSKV